MQQGIHHGAVVCAVAGGLDHHIAGKSQMVAQGKQLVLGRITGGVLALGGIGKFSARAKHMAMRIDSARRHLKAGLGWAVVPVQPTGGFGEFAHGVFHSSVMSSDE